MKVDWIVLANAAEAREGVVYLMSAGWDTMARPSYPSQLNAAVGMRLLFHRSEAREHHVEVQVATQDGTQLMPPVRFPLPVVVPQALPPGWDVAVAVAVTLSVIPIPGEGKYAIEVLLDDTHLKSLPFQAVLAPG